MDRPPVRFPPIPPEDMTEAQAQVAGQILAGRKSLSGPFNAMLRSPEAARPLQAVGHYLRYVGPMPGRLREFAILMVARYWTAGFEWHVHREIAEAEGLAPQAAEALLAGRRPDPIRDDEAAIYDFVAALLRTGRVGDAAFARVKVLLGEGQLSDLITLVGYYCTASFFLNVDRHPDPPGAAPMPELDSPPFADFAKG